jgi:hypothetical protein
MDGRKEGRDAFLKWLGVVERVEGKGEGMDTMEFGWGKVDAELQATK